MAVVSGFRATVWRVGSGYAPTRILIALNKSSSVRMLGNARPRWWHCRVSYALRRSVCVSAIVLLFII